MDVTIKSLYKGEPVAVVGVGDYLIYIKSSQGLVYCFSGDDINEVPHSFDDLLKDKSRKAVYEGDEITLKF